MKVYSDSRFSKCVSAKDRLHDKNFNQMKLEINETYQKDEKVTTNIQTSNDKDNEKKDFRMQN